MAAKMHHMVSEIPETSEAVIVVSTCGARAIGFMKIIALIIVLNNLRSNQPPSHSFKKMIIFIPKSPF
ncbi:MAG: hypothetical protein V1867_00960 [Candidatus Falkowbacteria bacterium]